MKIHAAVLYEAGRPLQVEEIEVLPPQRGEVQVRMHAAGVCHSDLHVMKGDLPIAKPIVMGHEGAGVIESVGEGVTSVAPGDHVILLWRLSCGVCEYCSSGRPALCDVGTEVRRTGKLSDGTTRFHASDGTEIRHFCGVSTFSQVSTMPEAAVVKIPADFPLEKAALLGCGVITGVGAVRNAAAVGTGDSVAVIGCGGIGLNAVQGARIAGARQIIAVDVVAERLVDAERMGATDVVDASTCDPVKVVRALTAGVGVDYAFEAIGIPATIEQALAVTRKSGTCVVIGITPAESRISVDANEMVYAEKTLVGSLYGSARPRIELPLYIEMHRQGVLRLEELLTRTYPLAAVNEAYEDLENGKLARGLIVFGE